MSAPGSNRMLEAIPADLCTALNKHLQPVPLPLRTILFEEGKRPRFVHFMTGGIASLVTAMAGGELVEVGLTGHEGFPEKTHLLGPQVSSNRCFVQVEGSALRMEFTRFQDLYRAHIELQQRVLQYVQYDTLSLGQMVACNRLHEVEPRLARWLLMLQDRLEQPGMDVTQEFLGEMLGTRRSTVSQAMVALQQSGSIEYRRAHVHISDRPKLEKAACECYSVIASLYRNLYCG